MKDELARIELLKGLLQRDAGRTAGVRVGIGDDAAVLDVAAGSLVWTVDAQVEGTHFRAAWLSWEDVGFRSYMAAASDLAAMGAEPLAALSGLVLPASFDDAALEALARGQAAAAAEVGAPVVGGNLARGAELSITTTLLGRAARPLLRDGAKPGEGLWLAGSLGLAAAGLAALAKELDDPRLEPAVQAWRRPRARIADGRTLTAAASAAIDISDGLARDASHVADASGVALVFEDAPLEAHAGPELAKAATLVGRDLLDLVFHGGEDYALLAASATPLAGFTRVGRVEARAEHSSPVMLATASGLRAVDTAGFDHFAG